jgi:pyruvate,orthophosphate dikinase
MTNTDNKLLYVFGGDKVDGDSSMATTLGGKGANLAEMSKNGLPVPPGFTLPTHACTAYYDDNQALSQQCLQAVDAGIKHIEAQVVGYGFGDYKNPLLVSVRSGAPISMPGMMDTVLNLGLNDKTVEGLAKKTDNPWFAYDSYRRFIQMYANVVLDLSHSIFEDALADIKRSNNIEQDSDLSIKNLQKIIKVYKKLVKKHGGDDFPQDVKVQLRTAVEAVFRSWMGDRAQTYRRLHFIDSSMGTGVTVQSMVFGNFGDTSGTGVLFTRNPSTGENKLYGEFLIKAQGEDVVAGVRTPLPIKSLGDIMPKVYKQLVDTAHWLEKHYRDMQDIEFTIQEGKLYILQARAGKRTAKAAIHIAIDLAEEGLISKSQALLKVDANSLDQLLHPTLDPEANKIKLGSGLAASPGAASGHIAFDADSAEQKAQAGKDVILVRDETSPDDIHGMHAAKGILTSKGGMTSHAAVVARGMGRPCICGASSFTIKNNTLVTPSGNTLYEDDVITIDGSIGEVYHGKIPTLPAELDEFFAKLMSWADEERSLMVFANAETEAEVSVADKFGAQGIGLCRTEHMFFSEDRLPHVRHMIMANGKEERAKALANLAPAQRDDFLAIMRIMHDRPIMIRLLDPPLHEFLPETEEDLIKLSKQLELSVDYLQQRRHDLQENNPMLGHRGCRLGITYPEIYEMQIEAIFKAQKIAQAELGIVIKPQIMLPLVISQKEMAFFAKSIKAVRDKLDPSLEYVMGTMIELPRAALNSSEIAQDADFFSFGTNDLTQTTLGVSRDDAGRFLPEYQSKGILSHDPFATLDMKGVAPLMEISVEKGRRVKPKLKVGICGEHGGDPKSIDFCNSIGMDYISCSPFRLPIARLAAAQSEVKRKNNKN